MSAILADCVNGIDESRFLSLRESDHPFSYSERDTMLYALSVGMGRDPLDTNELRFVFEDSGFVAIPTMAVVAARSTLPRTLPINMAMVLHGEQRLQIHKPLPTSANLLANTSISHIVDKGAGKGALIYSETVARLAGEDEPLFTTGLTLFARGDGGFGGSSSPVHSPHALPSRSCDHVHISQTRPDQALLYRLTGDRNPLHADPGLARAAGFPKPILHGLCTYGIACRAILATICDDPTRLRSFDVRFTSPVYPGDRIETEIWADHGTLSFRCTVPERGVTVIDNGRCEITCK